MKHEQPRADIVAVLKDQKFSCACGAEARCQKRAPFDGIAINGVLFSMQEYMVPVMWMLEFVKEREKNAKKPRAKKDKR